MLQPEDPTPIVRYFLVTVEALPDIAAESIALTLTGSLTWVEGIGQVTTVEREGYNLIGPIK